MRCRGCERRGSLEHQCIRAFQAQASSRTTPGALAKVGATPQKVVRTERRQFEISANDKRFLRSLRIAADETQEKEVE